MVTLFPLRGTVMVTFASTSTNNALTKPRNMEREPQIASMVRPRTARITNSVASCISTVPLNPPAHRPQTTSEMIRAKQTNPLNQIVRARRCGDRIGTCNYGSSGSDHDPCSGCLADMVRGFMEDEEHTVGNYGKWRCNCLGGFGKPCSDNNGIPGEEDDDELEERNISQGFSSGAFVNGDLGDLLEGLVACMNNPVESLLIKEAAEAVQKEDQNPSNEKEIKFRKTWLRRSVMKHLGGLGYNAGICQSRWEHTGRFPSGDYEYIDVLIDGKDRLFLDIDFRAQFEIARPTSQYDVLVQCLPNIFVGKGGRLQQIIKIMCDSAKRSLKKKGMHLPPWRNHGYLRAKWFGPYNRTADAIPTKLATCNQQSLVGDFSSIALKRAAWANGFTQKMELRYKKSAQEANQKPVTSKPSVAEEIKGRTTEWKPPTVSSKSVPTGRQGKVSGLSCALNGAACTCFAQIA